MKSTTPTFAKLIERFRHYADLRTVFDDFLTMTICAFGHNPQTGKSYDEDLYLETIAKYKGTDLRFLFPEILGALTLEMEHRLTDSMGNDVLGDYYEMNIPNKGLSQFFTPWPICEFMAACLISDDREDNETLHVLDPCCGSGRTLLCSAKKIGRQHHYYGIDIDHMCVKMTALNLFLNGVFHAEVMWGNALTNDDFRMSYVTSFLPFGIFRITDREKSPLWRRHQNTFTARQVKSNVADIKLSFEGGDTYGDGSQLTLF